GARVGYALADAETALELNQRQAPLAVSTLSAALAVAALSEPPDMSPVVAERERLAEALEAIGLDPWPSRANFLFVSHPDPETIGGQLRADGMIVRIFPEGIRISVRDREDDDLLIDCL